VRKSCRYKGTRSKVGEKSPLESLKRAMSANSVDRDGATTTDAPEIDQDEEEEEEEQQADGSVSNGEGQHLDT
jgi:hypothetical protein